ncbi:MAG: ABC-ATPase domain-containing protein, partial [Nitrospirota bacterium]|nr:ABC-ATPase domain-containing protein [Nitrospirota bacterium]
MKSHSDLRQHLLRLDGRGYKAYKDLEGAYDFQTFTLSIDHVQGDPF